MRKKEIKIKIEREKDKDIRTARKGERGRKKWR